MDGLLSRRRSRIDPAELDGRGTDQQIGSGECGGQAIPLPVRQSLQDFLCHPFQRSPGGRSTTPLTSGSPVPTPVFGIGFDHHLAAILQIPQQPAE